jgi:hypothetical protein
MRVCRHVTFLKIINSRRNAISHAVVKVKKNGMKKLLLLPVILSSFFSLWLLQGCLKDSFQRTYTYTYYTPVYKTTAEVRANIKSNAPQNVERPGKIYLYGSYIFLNEIDKGIHIIDNSNPAQPRNAGFIDIPGNMDLAVKGNILYADLYTDLVAIDITDPKNVILKKTVENVFPHRYYNGYFMPDSSMVITAWEKRDTTIREKGDAELWLKNNRGGVFMDYAASSQNSGIPSSQSSGSAAVAPYGVGGSMARFTIAKERLYTVGITDLTVFNIVNSADPVQTGHKDVGWNIETIYPFKDNLFIGSQSGMFIYNISNVDNPVQTGQFGHVQSCDPVIADDRFVYVTLRSGTTCQGFNNQLEILHLNNVVNPSLLKVYPLTNPHGLSKDGSTLFICDGADGLKIYNTTDLSNLSLINHINGIETYDVIAHNSIALVVAKDGLYQYDYSNLPDIKLLSKISLSK